MKHEFYKLKDQNPAGIAGTILRKLGITEPHEYYECFKCGVLYCKLHNEYILSLRKATVKNHPCKVRK